MAKVIYQTMPGGRKKAGKKRVAAYARISCVKDAMLHTLSAQVSYFSDLIQRNPDWIFAGIYADEVTGPNSLCYIFQDGQEQEVVWQNHSRRDSWTDDMRVQAAAHARRRYDHE